MIWDEWGDEWGIGWVLPRVGRSPRLGLRCHLSADITTEEQQQGCSVIEDNHHEEAQALLDAGILPHLRLQ